MATQSKKRRSQKNRSHQSVKVAQSGGQGIPWMRIVAIVVGVLIVLSMVMSLIVTPGSHGGGF